MCCVEERQTVQRYLKLVIEVYETEMNRECSDDNDSILESSSEAETFFEVNNCKQR